MTHSGGRGCPAGPSGTTQVRLQLFALAYNLANLLRSLVLPNEVAHWSLSRLREELVKFGARIVRHGCYPARCSGLTGASRGAAGAEERAMRRGRSTTAKKQPGSQRGLVFSGSSHPRSAARHALLLTFNRPRSRVSSVDRAHLGDVA